MVVQCAMGTSGMSVNFCMWVVIQLLSKCCHMQKSGVDILITQRFALSRDMCIVDM